MLEPSIVILYVNNLTKSREFYQDLLGIKSEELSPSFNQFTVSNGMCLGLKIKDTVEDAFDFYISDYEKKNGVIKLRE